MVSVAQSKSTPDPRPSRRTIYDVARHANVSITTVSRTINGSTKVDHATAMRVRKAIEELKYFPNTQARSLVSGRSRILGLIVSDITNPFFPELIKHFEEFAVGQGYEVLIASTNYQTDRMALCVRRMLERSVEGVAIMTSEMDYAQIDQVTRRNVPLVFLDQNYMAERMNSVIVDYASGIIEAVDHLVGLGHRRIAFIGGPMNLQSARARRTAFLEALEERSVHVEDGLFETGDHKVRGGVDAMNRLLALKVRPTAVLASNDLTAVGAITAARRAHVSVPRDLSMVGFDDIWLAEFTDPPLTTVRFPTRRVAELACRALLAGVETEAAAPKYAAATHLVVRETTCAL